MGDWGAWGDGKMGEDKREAKVRSSNSSVSINFKSDQVHQNPWKSIKHGSTGSLKKVPKTASIECCARPPVPQVVKVCFILVLGHRYETWSLVFYRGVLKRKTVARSALMPNYSIEKMVSKKTCAPPFYRGCFEGVTCTPRIYIYKMVGHKCRPEFTGGSFTSRCFYVAVSVHCVFKTCLRLFGTLPCFPHIHASCTRRCTVDI